MSPPGITWRMDSPRDCMTLTSTGPARGEWIVDTRPGCFGMCACAWHCVQISPWCLLNWLMEVSLSQYGSDVCTLRREGDGGPADRKWERRGGWKWRRGNEMEREEGKRKRGYKSRGLWEKRDSMVEKKQFRRRDGKSRWFMRYVYLVNGVFAQFLPGWKRTPRLSHAFCHHLPLPAAMITCTDILIYTYL